MSPRVREEISPLETTCQRASDLQSNSSLKVIKSSQKHAPGGEKYGRLQLVVSGAPCLLASGVKWLLRLTWDPFLLLSSPMSQESESDTRSGSTDFVPIIQSVQPSKLGQVTCINISRPNVSWQECSKIEIWLFILTVTSLSLTYTETEDFFYEGLWSDSPGQSRGCEFMHFLACLILAPLSALLSERNRKMDCVCQVGNNLSLPFTEIHFLLCGCWVSLNLMEVNHEWIWSTLAFICHAVDLLNLFIFNNVNVNAFSYLRVSIITKSVFFFFSKCLTAICCNFIPFTSETKSNIKKKKERLSR